MKISDMIYPATFEQKIGFDRLREQVAALCSMRAARERLAAECFSTSAREIGQRLAEARAEQKKYVEKEKQKGADKAEKRRDALQREDRFH